jgi:hypothetical protein
MRDLPQTLEDMRATIEELQKRMVRKQGGKNPSLSKRDMEAFEHMNRAKSALGLARAALLERALL